MAAVELATAYVTLAAEGSEITKALAKSFSQGEKMAAQSGQKMGKAMGDAMAKKDPYEKVTAAAEKAKSAQEKLATATGRASRSQEQSARAVEIAEKRVQEVRERSIRANDEVKAAEKQLTAARKGDDTGAIIRAEKALADAREGVKPTSADLAAEDRLLNARQKQAESAELAKVKLDGYRKAQDRANAELDEAKRSAEGAEKSTRGAAGAFERMGDRIKAAMKGDFKSAFKTVEKQGDTSADKVRRDFDRAGRRAGDGFAGGFKDKLKGGMVGVAATIGAAVSVDQIMNFAGAAGDLEQSVGAVEAVFKDSSGQMKKWSDDAATNVGISSNQYNEFASVLGASLKNAGTPIDELGDKTNGLITMGADLASLYGGTTAEAVDALGSALRGEMDPIEKYGISLNDAALTAKGLEMGIKKTGGAFTTQQKQTISLALLQDQATDAMGNFNRESNTFAHKQQVMTAKWDDMKATLGERLMPVLGDLFSWVSDKGLPMMETFTDGISGVWSILTQGDFKGAANTFGLEEDSKAVGVLFTIREAALKVGEVITGTVIPAMKGVVQWLKENQAWLVPVAAGILAIVGAWKLYQTWLLIVAGVTKAYAAVQAALNAVMAMNPIGLIVLAIIGLAAAFVVAYKRSETFRNIVNGAWESIKAAAGAVAGWFMNHVWPVMKAAWDGIAAGAIWLYQNAILPAWNGIKTAIQVVGDWITGTLWPALQTAWQAIGTAAMWLWQNVIQPVWNGIKIAIAIAVTAVLVYIDLMKFYFQNVIAPVAMWLWKNVIQPVWNGIKAAIGAVASWIVNTAWPLIKSAWDAIAGAAQWLYRSVILPVWNAIKAAIGAVVSWLMNTAWPVVKKVIDWYAAGFKWLYNSVILPVWNWIKGAINAVVQWFQNTAWPLVNKVIGWLKMSFEGWKLIAQTVWSAIKTAIKAVSDWLTGTLWPAIKNVIEKLKSGFNAMRDSIKNAWKYVQDKAIQPVMNWLTGTVKPKIDTLTDNIKNAFTTMKDSVLKAWDKIKDGMKSPINGIIRIYNKHVKGNFDNVAGKLGLDTKLPEMSEFATGGYTGPGAKYTPAGIVHADEYVIRKESQNDLRRNAPGFLDSLNRYGARALGYATGGLVKLRAPFSGSYPRGDGFGARGGRHKGIDWPMPSGAVLKAVGAGSVRHTRNAAAGNKLELTLGNGLVAGYHHLSQYIAKNGSSVGSGADVARVGSTGRSSGPHLHFSLQRDGKYVDPAPYLGAGGSAGSGDGGGWWNPFDGLWSKIKGEVSEAVGGGWIGDVLTKTASNTVGWAKDWVFDKIGEAGDFVVETGKTVAGVAGVTARWGALATRALAMTGDMNPMNHASMMRRMNQESGGNARAVNNWDSNAKKGTPSKGLMQVIPPTFRAYAHPEYNKDIFDPLSNMLASIRYTKAAYGSVRRGWDRKGGYAAGGWTGPGSKYQPAGIVHADEHVIRKESRASIERARPGFLDRLNAYGASALKGYANGGRVSPTAKIGSTKVTVILDGLVGTEKQVKSAAGKLADGIAKTFQDRFKGNQKKTVAGLADSLKALKAQASQLKKTMSVKSSAAKKTTVNRLSDDLASLRAQAKRLDPKKQAKQLASVRKQIESTQSALTKARRGDYSGAAAATAAKLKDVQKQIASTEAALKSARSGNTSAAASKAADAFFTKYAASATAKLQSLAKQTDSLNAKLKTARTSLADAMKVRDEYATSMTEKLAGAYALSADSATTGIETIIRGFKNAASTVSGFSGQLATLKKRGLSTGLLDQIAQLGAEDGSKVARNLLTASTAQVKQITAQYNALNSASAKTGTSLGKQMHQAGVDTAQGYVNGLTKQLASVTKASQRLADTVVATVRKKLGIHSPSRVFTEIGEYTGEGMVIGIDRSTPDVQAAMNRLATPPEAFSGEFSASARGGASGGPFIENATVYGLSAEDVAREFDKLVRRRESLYS